MYHLIATYNPKRGEPARTPQILASDDDMLAVLAEAKSLLIITDSKPFEDEMSSRRGGAGILLSERGRGKYSYWLVRQD